MKEQTGARGTGSAGETDITNKVVDEDAPVNNISSGAIKGSGGLGGEPGVPTRFQPKTKKSVPNGLWENNPVMGDMVRRSPPVMETRRRESFAGAVVFEVSSKIFHNLTLSKRKGKHWRTYLEEDDCYSEIREWANKNKGPIVVRNENTGEMRFIRHGR
jgi:hypothetical protein